VIELSNLSLFLPSIPGYINLDRNNLQGSIPSELGQLTLLRKCDSISFVITFFSLDRRRSDVFCWHCLIVPAKQNH
jgi:hypothetical protein